MLFKLGQKAVDSVTGFCGVITARTQYMKGSDCFLLEPECVSGVQQEPRWFDVGRLQVIRRFDTGEASAKQANVGCVDTSPPVEPTDENTKRPSLSPFLELALASLGIVKVIPCDDRDCSVCSIARERGDTPQH